METVPDRHLHLAPAAPRRHHVVGVEPCHHAGFLPLPPSRQTFPASSSWGVPLIRSMVGRCARLPLSPCAAFAINQTSYPGKGALPFGEASFPPGAGSTRRLDSLFLRGTLVATRSSCSEDDRVRHPGGNAIKKRKAVGGLSSQTLPIWAELPAHPTGPAIPSLRGSILTACVGLAGWNPAIRHTRPQIGGRTLKHE